MLPDLLLRSFWVSAPGLLGRSYCTLVVDPHIHSIMIGKRCSFRGTVTVPSGCLYITGLSSPQNEELNEDSTTWSKHGVAAEGLKHNGNRNIICVLGCDEKLQAVLGEANFGPDALWKHSSDGHFLELNYLEKESMRVLQGRDLVLAGRHLLLVRKRWRNVRLYAESIKSKFSIFHLQMISYTRADFHEIEHYLSLKEIPSGEAFRMLHLC